MDSPVVLLVSPPGHGKSSVGNLLLGQGHFQVRGSGSGGTENMQVNSGQLYSEGSRVTCIESPGLYEDGVDIGALEETEKHLNHIGYLTHLLVVWDALEWRNEDLDFVLGFLKAIFGSEVAQHFIFVVNFWDSDSKSRKERNKRKVSFSTIENMIIVKTQNLFNTSFEPAIFFVSSKNPNDRSREDLVNYLSSQTSWPTFRTGKMNKWTHHISTSISSGIADNPTVVEDDGHDYEDVSRVSSLRGKGKDKSKSMFDLAQPTPKKSGKELKEKKYGGSMFGLQSPGSTGGNPKSRTRGRTPSPFGTLKSPKRGKGQGTNLARKRSMSTGNLLSGGRGRGKRPVMMHQKSVDNVYVDDMSREQGGDIDPAARNVDSIIQDEEIPSGRSRRRRVISGSSLTLNLRGSSRDRRKKSSSNMDISHDNADKNTPADSSFSSRNGSRFSQNRRKASLSNLTRQRSKTNLNRSQGSRTSINQSNPDISRKEDDDDMIADERRGSKSNPGRGRRPGARSNQPPRTRGRSRSRQPQPRSRPGSRPPPPECSIL